MNIRRSKRSTLLISNYGVSSRQQQQQHKGLAAYTKKVIVIDVSLVTGLPTGLRNMKKAIEREREAAGHKRERERATCVTLCLHVHRHLYIARPEGGLQHWALLAVHKELWLLKWPRCVGYYNFPLWNYPFFIFNFFFFFFFFSIHGWRGGLIRFVSLLLLIQIETKKKLW